MPSVGNCSVARVAVVRILTAVISLAHWAKLCGDQHHAFQPNFAMSSEVLVGLFFVSELSIF